MTIPSIDSYLLKEIRPRLKTVLEHCYIIDEVLKDFDEQSRDSFKEAFCGKDATQEVTVGFNFPKFKTNHGAHYLIQLGNGEETKDSLGSVQGTFDTQSGDTLVEKSIAVREDDRLVFTVKNNIDTVLHVEDIAFATFDDMRIEGNKITFRYDTNESYEGYNAIITYVEQTGTHKGMVKGFTVNEQATIVGLSYNVDVARCLDAILKMILISMRDSVQEQQTYQLQNLSFGDMAPIIEDGEEMIFGRPTIISYTSSVDIDYIVVAEINQLTFKERKDWKK